MIDPKYKVRQRFMMNKAIYVISEVKYVDDKATYLYIVDAGLFGFYEYQLKDEYFKFKEPRFKRKVS